jgi:tRNA A-37 threonylcarbamoyl transferase component Bud32
MNLKPITPDRFTDSRLFIHETSGRKLLIKVFLGENRDQRKELETRKMIRWKAAGFCVPELIDLQLPDMIEPYLVMEFISGDTLKNFLRAGGLVRIATCCWSTPIRIRTT